jgi:hypothetical protein
MTQADRDAATRRQRAQTIALWRWSLIEPAMDPALSSRQRGQIVRGIAGCEHAGPFGARVSVSRKTTGGSPPGAPAGSTRWSPRRGSACRGPTRSWWTLRSG